MRFTEQSSVQRPDRVRSTQFLKNEQKDQDMLILGEEIAACAPEIIASLPDEPETDEFYDAMNQMSQVERILLLFSQPEDRRHIYERVQAFLPFLEEAYQGNVQARHLVDVASLQKWILLLAPEKRIQFDNSPERASVFEDVHNHLKGIHTLMQQTGGSPDFDEYFQIAFLFPEKQAYLKSTFHIWKEFMTVLDSAEERSHQSIAELLSSSLYIPKAMDWVQVAALCPEFHFEKHQRAWTAAILSLQKIMREFKEKRNWDKFVQYALLLKTLSADSMSIDATGIQFFSSQTAAPASLPERNIV